MAALFHHVVSFAALFSYGLYHLFAACRAHLKSTHLRDYAAQPYHPLPFASNGSRFLRHLPIYLLLLFLVLASMDQALLAASAMPVQRLNALQSALVILLFFILAASLLLAQSRPQSFPLPPDLSFLLAALAFGLRSLSSSRSAASYDPPNDLPALCEAISSTVAAISSALCLSLAVFPKLFVAELALAASISLQGLWSLQTGLFLYAEAFIPEGCHKMLDVATGIEGSTRCELQESRLRAAALLDLAITIHATIVATVMIITYVAVARATGSGRILGSYEALSTASSAGAVSDMDHVQMKAVGKSAMQA